jgi:hypothetical protein
MYLDAVDGSPAAHAEGAASVAQVIKQEPGQGHHIGVHVQVPANMQGPAILQPAQQGDGQAIAQVIDEQQQGRLLQGPPPASVPAVPAADGGVSISMPITIRQRRVSQGI